MRSGKRRQDDEAKLAKEFERLKAVLGLPELSLKWLPGRVKHDGSGKRISGEVASSTVLIYDEDVKDALRTLRHELIDYAITSEVVKPLVSLINLLVKQREHEIYERKEKLVKKLRG